MTKIFPNAAFGYWKVTVERPLRLHSRAHDRHEYLLFPNQGRRLDDVSRAAVEAHASTSPDVQIIVGDGLSPNAIVQNGAATLAALRGAFAGAGWRTGVPQ